MSSKRQGISRRSIVAAIGTAPLFGCGSQVGPGGNKGGTTSTPGGSSGPGSSSGSVDSTSSTGATSFPDSASSSKGSTSEGSSSSDSEKAPELVDVAIIGAGLSGLVAARELRRNDLSVRILEARDAVGGRVMDHRLAPGVVAEGGAQWVTPAQTAILELASELGVKIFSASVAGKTRLHFEGLSFDQDSLEESEEVRRLRAELDGLASKIPADAPWSASDAKALDSKTVAQWLVEKKASAETIQSFTLSVAMMLGDIHKISLLYYLFYIASAGGLEKLDTDAQSHRLVGGPEQLATKMAGELGDRIWVDCPVREIVHGPDSTMVHCARGRIKARQVILALSPADARKIEFSPPLPAQRRQLQENWTMQPGTKLHLVYDRPFWRDRGLSGTLMSDLPLTAFAVDASPPDASVGVLAVFPNDAALPDSKAARQKSLTAEIQKLFGNNAPTPKDYIETRWEEQAWISGCTSPLGPGVLSQQGPALRKSVGSLHWAGTESSAIWCGYMEGAIRSGRRAAVEAAKALAAG